MRAGQNESRRSSMKLRWLSVHLMMLRWVGIVFTQLFFLLVCGLLTMSLMGGFLLVLTETHAPALILPYVFMGVAAIAVGKKSNLLRETFFLLPVVPRRELLLSPFNLAMLILYALVLPMMVALALFYVVNMTAQQATVMFIGCATATLLGINSRLNPASWDSPLFGLRAIGRGLAWVFAHSVWLGLLLVGAAFGLVFYPTPWLRTFIISPLGGNPLAEVAYFFISPIGSIWRLQLGGAPAWMPLALQGVLVAGALAAAVSVWRTLRVPIRELETAEFEGFRDGRPPSSTYLGRMGALDMARGADGAGDDDREEIKEALTLEQLNQRDHSYRVGSSPEQVLEGLCPLLTWPLFNVMLVLFCGVVITVFFKGHLTWPVFTQLVGGAGLAWFYFSMGVVQTPGGAQCLPGRWPAVVRQQLRKGGWQLVGVNLAIALAVTALGPGPWWLFFVLLILYVEAYLIYFGIQWLSLHEKGLNRVAGLTSLITLVVVAIFGGLAALVEMDDSEKFAKHVFYLVVMLAVYFGVILLPLSLWQARRTGWQINGPSPPAGMMGNLLREEDDEED